MFSFIVRHLPEGVCDAKVYMGGRCLNSHCTQDVQSTEPRQCFGCTMCLSFLGDLDSRLHLIYIYNTLNLELILSQSQTLVVKEGRKLGFIVVVLNSGTRKLRKIEMIVFLFPHQLDDDLHVNQLIIYLQLIHVFHINNTIFLIWVELYAHKQ